MNKTLCWLARGILGTAKCKATRAHYFRLLKYEMMAVQRIETHVTFLIMRKADSDLLIQ